MNQAFWRKWHRWIGIVAAPFLLYAAATGVVLAANEFFCEEEAERERLRDVASPVTLPAPTAAWSDALTKAFATAAAQAPGYPVDKVTLEFKGDHPAVIVYTGRPTGGEDRKFVIDAATGEVRAVESYFDKPFLVRLHSGEAWGDGGLVAAMAWGTGLVFVAVTGLVIYWKMRRKTRTGLGRVFWAVLFAVVSCAEA
jgi:uncharacterized iron-regulated membrane protein